MNTRPLPSTVKIRALAALLLMLVLFALPARAELAIIVNPQSGVEQLSRSQIINIFLGNHREFPNGLAARPLDQPTSAAEKSLFYRLLVNRDLDQMAAYWARLVFAGNTQPPAQAGSAQEVIQSVASNRGAIGYIDRKSVDNSRVKVVFVLP